MEQDPRPVTWHQAYLSCPVIAQLREGGPMHQGKIVGLGRTRLKLRMFNGRNLHRKYGKVWFPPR